MDVDKEKIRMLQRGEIPIFEPGLKELAEHNIKEGRLHFTTDSKEAITSSDVIFICVGTPSKEDGTADLKYVFEAARNIGRYMDSYKVVVDKSTVPVGTSEKIKQIIRENQAEQCEFDIVSNPEFLREGLAISDFTIPDRIVIGVESGKAKEAMIKLYRAIERTGRPILVTDIKSAEIIKYASNGMLAARISFMNMLAPLCESVGADVKLVAKGIGLDSRIGPRFLQAGVGYGGSCFPKDVRAMIKTLEEHGCDASILKAVDALNEHQKESLLPKLKKALPDLEGKTVALWGLAFKPRTDDMREAPSLVVIRQLLAEGASVQAFDPVVAKVVSRLFPTITLASDPYEAIKDSDALVIVTEWDEFRELDFKKVKDLMKSPVIIDGRNLYEPEEMKALGFSYQGVGR